MERFWIFNSNHQSLFGYVQLVCDKKATKLTSSKFVSYPIHAVLLNMSPENRELLMNNVYIGFIPVSIWEISVDEDDAVSNIDD